MSNPPPPDSPFQVNSVYYQFGIKEHTAGKFSPLLSSWLYRGFVHRPGVSSTTCDVTEHYYEFEDFAHITPTETQKPPKLYLCTWKDESMVSWSELLEHLSSINEELRDRNAPTPKRRWFQFRLSFLLCVTGLLGVLFAGVVIGGQPWNEWFPSARSWTAVLWGAARWSIPLVAGIVLLRGRENVCVAMGIGFAVTSPIAFCLDLFWGNMEAQLMFDISLWLGILLGILWMLWRRITVVELLTGTVACFYLGACARGLVDFIVM